MSRSLAVGRFFFALYRQGLLAQEKPAAILSDINPELIDTYLTVRDQPDDVMKLLDTYPYEKSFYRTIAKQVPSSLTKLERAAQLIYLNKTSFGGLLQKTPQGYYDPKNYASPKPLWRYYDPDNIGAVAQALREAEILCASYETVLERARPGDWVYLDPPYHGADQRLYAHGKFDEIEQRKVAEVFRELASSGVYVTASNSDTEFVRSLYKGFYIRPLTIQNCLSRSGKTKHVAELIITSYPTNAECGTWMCQR